jgi:hypothetical protein
MTASSLAITRSAQSAKSLPPPRHQPCTCAITGFGQCQMVASFLVGESCGAVAITKSLPGSQRPSVSIASLHCLNPPPKS